MGKLKGKNKHRQRKYQKKLKQQQYERKQRQFLNKIHKWDHPTLYRQCEPLNTSIGEAASISKEVKQVLQATEDGVGLAAPQIGYTKKLFAIKSSPQNDDVKIFIDPYIVEYSEETGTAVEGCLSYPGVFCYVDRYQRVRVLYLDEEGTERDEWFEEYQAIIIQHEYDHLYGLCKIRDHWKNELAKEDQHQVETESINPESLQPKSSQGVYPKQESGSGKSNPNKKYASQKAEPRDDLPPVSGKGHYKGGIAGVN